jgi:hypothetical protein
VAEVSGKYFIKRKPAESGLLSRDPEVAAEIWRCTQKMIGINPA